MKMELGPEVPDGITEAWPGQFTVFPWYYYLMDTPTPLFIVTTLKDNGRANAQLNTWGMMAGSGSEPKFIFHLLNVSDTKRLIEKNGEFVINYPSASLKPLFMKTAAHYTEADDEVTASGLSHEASAKVKPPRVAECFAHLECRLDWMRDVETDVKRSTLIQGSIVHASIDQAVLSDDLRDSQRKRGWAFFITETVNPLSGVHQEGLIGTLDISGAVPPS